MSALLNATTDDVVDPIRLPPDLGCGERKQVPASELQQRRLLTVALEAGAKRVRSITIRFEGESQLGDPEVDPRNKLAVVEHLVLRYNRDAPRRMITNSSSSRIDSSRGSASSTAARARDVVARGGGRELTLKFG